MSLEDIKARAEAATEGPWQARQVEDNYNSASDCQLIIGAEAYIHGDSDADRADAEFIAHARTDIPKLVAAIEAVQAKVKELQGDISGEPQEIGNALEHIITDALGD